MDIFKQGIKKSRIATASWAESGTRTRDLLITNELLYQLSYFGSLLLKSDANLRLILNLQKEI